MSTIDAIEVMALINQKIGGYMSIIFLSKVIFAKNIAIFYSNYETLYICSALILHVRAIIAKSRIVCVNGGSVSCCERFEYPQAR